MNFRIRVWSSAALLSLCGTAALLPSNASAVGTIPVYHWAACNNTACDSGAKSCTDSTQYAVYVHPAYKCGANLWAGDCSNWNLSQLCTQTIHYLGDCSTVNSESDTYANECG